MALRTIDPLLALVPVLAVLVWFGIARGLRPLQRVAAAVGERSPRALEPLAEAGLPIEVRPLVHALNGLLERLDRALGSQRAFIADAAHELRTPLNAVHLQAQLAERAQSDAERARALADLRAGLGRATHLVEQLLTLAREEPGVSERSFAPVNLTELAHASLPGTPPSPLRSCGSRDRDPDGSAPDVIFNGDAAGLQGCLNLVDNAVHTRGGRRVDVRSPGPGAVTLEVRDNGPGIPAAERVRVFDRFYRVPLPGAARLPGSGLGLAIAKRIAERHDAQIALASGIPGPSGEGLCVSVRFPPTPQAQ
jgi:signal transduction histidine kinase